MKCPNFVISINRRLSITLSILMILSVSPLVFAQNPDQDERYKSLAEYWSPVICQDVDGSSFLADYILKFDYDGDYNAWNNSDNLNRSGVSYDPRVYYWVVETETHYFIGYGLFHPIDWKVVSGHENDFEGAVLCIKKNEQNGKFVSLITEAHGDIYRYVDTDTISPEELTADAYQDVDFIKEMNEGELTGIHPIVYVEARGHGVYADFPTPSKRIFNSQLLGELFTGVIEAPQFKENYTGFYTYELEYDRDGKLKLLTDDMLAGNMLVGTPDRRGLIYKHSSTLDLPSDSNESLEDWPIVGYSLVSINDLWRIRYNVGEYDGSTYRDYGVFGGIVSLGSQNPKPPWGWCESEQLDIFMNPASYFADECNPTADELSTKYFGRSYDAVYETHHPFDRSCINFCWVVPGSKYLDLNLSRVDLGEDLDLLISGRGILKRIENTQSGITSRIEADEFRLNISSRSSKDESSPWGFVLDWVNAVPYLSPIPDRLESDEGDTLNKDQLPAKDPDGPSEIRYRLRWNETAEFDSDWNAELKHTFEDDDNYGPLVLVRLFDNLSESAEYKIPLNVRNVPPRPEINLNELSNSTEDENVTLQFTIYAGDPAGEHDQPYTYNITIVRYGNESLKSENVSLNESAVKKDEVYLTEVKQVNNTRTRLATNFTKGNYTAFVTVTDDGGASGKNETSFCVNQSLKS